MYIYKCYEQGFHLIINFKSPYDSPHPVLRAVKDK